MSTRAVSEEPARNRTSAARGASDTIAAAPHADQAVVRTRGVIVRYPGSVEIALPDLRVAARDHLVVVGPSGSGKTTLLHVLGGLVRVAEGEVEVAGVRLDRLEPTALERARSRRVGIVFQQFHLADGYTALENVMVALIAAGGSLRTSRERAMEGLSSLGVAHRARAYPRTLSVGERQRVAIARAIAIEPALILADEPSANLDRSRASAAVDLLLTTAERVGAALLVATHDPTVMQKFDRQVNIA